MLRLMIDLPLLFPAASFTTLMIVGNVFEWTERKRYV
jgi:hypothetical protein